MATHNLPTSAVRPTQPGQPDRSFADVVLPAKRQPLTLRAPSLANLGPLAPLVGVWTAQGTGWNMIALPFQGAPASPAGFKFRVLMNQYDEELRFSFVDDGIKNRGLLRQGETDFDQVVAALDYQQRIAQVVAEDRPSSGGLAGPPKLAIHHEPGLWLFERNRRVKDDQIKGDAVSEVELSVARLASIPHGNSVIAAGTATVIDGKPVIPKLSGLPSGRFEDVSTPDYDFKTDPYLEPYLFYINHPFVGNVTGVPGFPGFHPADMNDILRFASVNGPEIAKTTVLEVDSTRKSGGIRNLPFTVREAEPVSMKSTFWIQELVEKDAQGATQFQLQYSQIVMLQFFRPREDELPGLALWPHISIATLSKVPAPYPLANV